MTWWMWVGLLLGWVALAVLAALWMGAAAVVVRRKDDEVRQPWDDDVLEHEWDADLFHDDVLRREFRDFREEHRDDVADAGAHRREWRDAG